MDPPFFLFFFCVCVPVCRKTRKHPAGSTQLIFHFNTTDLSLQTSNRAAVRSLNFVLQNRQPRPAVIREALSMAFSNI